MVKWGGRQEEYAPRRIYAFGMVALGDRDLPNAHRTNKVATVENFF